MYRLLTSVMLALALLSSSAHAQSTGLPVLCVEVWEGAHQIGAAQMELVADTSSTLLLARAGVPQDPPSLLHARDPATESADAVDYLTVSLLPTVHSGGTIKMDVQVATVRFNGIYESGNNDAMLHAPSLAWWGDRQSMTVTEGFNWQQVVTKMNTVKSRSTRISDPYVDWELKLSHCPPQRETYVF